MSNGGGRYDLEPAHLLDGLRRVCDLQFTATSASLTGWNGIGHGSVVVESPGPEVVTFRESGLWRPDGGSELRFSNVYRWSVVGSQTVRLEHLRFGPGQPVLLFELAPELEEVWSSVSPHQCRDDCYSARLQMQDEGILLRWAIVGPQKREDIEYIYRW
jgi:hypothetical protein